MTFEEAWVRCCFCLASLYMLMTRLLIAYYMQVRTIIIGRRK